VILPDGAKKPHQRKSHLFDLIANFLWQDYNVSRARVSLPNRRESVVRIAIGNRYSLPSFRNRGEVSL
jgi:hypothetical protein